MDAAAATVVIIVALLASAVQGLTGFGFALIVVPFLLLVLDVQDAVVIASLLSAANVALLAGRVWRDTPWATVVRLVAGSLVGMPAGLAVLVLMPQDGLRIAVAASVVVVVALLAAGLPLRAGGTVGELAAGAASGLLRTSTSLGGPPLVLYLQSEGHGPQTFRAAITMVFLFGSVPAIAGFFATDVVRADALVLAAVALPSVVVGNLAGGQIMRLVDAEAFRRAVLALLALTAIAAIASSVVRLAG